MKYYEVWPADGRYRSDKPLTYSYDDALEPLSVVSIPLQKRLVSGFVRTSVSKPAFAVKPIKALLSQKTLPAAYLNLAQWMRSYYSCSLGDCLRQLAPPQPALRKVDPEVVEIIPSTMPINIEGPLTKDQTKAIKAINNKSSTTVLLHGDTGSGKTRVYLELAKACLEKNQSIILLTPEISLTSQLEQAALQLDAPVYVFHSRISVSQRKKIWLAILESTRPVIVIGPRSALFSPVRELGLIVVDEAHEPAYKQDQIPRYHTSRIASQLGQFTEAKVILGTATPLATDYYLASQKDAVVQMNQPAVISKHGRAGLEIVDIKNRGVFSRSQYFSKPLIDAITTTLSAKKQVMVYLNKRGSARIILCNNCGWQLLCPNCDVPLIYHGDSHITRCHICGYTQAPPSACPDCKNQDIIYKSVGVKALAYELGRLFPNSNIKRFDSDNLRGEHLSELYPELVSGKVDILVGTQLLAKGLDLPKLGLVGIIAAESSLSLPDYSSEERSFQLLYQVMGRVGRGHGVGHAIIQTYEPDSIAVKAAMARDYGLFYRHCLDGRQKFRFPPFSYLLKLTCRRATYKGAETAAQTLKTKLAQTGLPVEIIGPAPSFYGKRASYFYWQIVIKSKKRGHLVEMAKLAPADWTVDLDPINLL